MRERHKELLDLLDSSGAWLYTLLTRLILREDAAEELMQELFIKLTNSRGFVKSENKGAYARRVAINLAFDWRRKNCKTNHHSLVYHRRLCYCIRFIESDGMRSSASATVMTIRVKKSDVDLYAQNELDYDKFRQKVQIIMY
ncbi:RNA polymerase sigma factor [Planctomycetota bacterium]